MRLVIEMGRLRWNSFWVISCLAFLTGSSPENNSAIEIPDQKFVVYNGVFSSEFDIQKAISSYSRLADYHSAASLDHAWNFRFYPRITVLNILAKAANATMTYGDKLVDKHPQIKLLPSSIWSPLVDYQNKSYNMSGDKFPQNVLIIKVEPNNCAFIYCDFIRQEDISEWDFTLLLIPFDKRTWLLLIIVFLVVVPLSGKFSSVIMPILSATFSIGTTGLAEKSKIFILWMAMCMILGNMYSGEVTSKIMVPPKDAVLTEFWQLEDRNYTAIAPQSTNQMLGNVINYLENIRSTSGQIAKRLLETVKIVDAQIINEILLFNTSRFVVIGPWTYIHLVDWSCRSLARNQEERKCHLGKELVQMGDNFVIFLPPRNSELATTYQKLIEAGIHQRWDQEVNGIMHSQRVQDRVRVKSPTTILEEAVPVKAQRLKGKMVTMFLLWGVCVIISLIGFGLELIVRIAIIKKTFHLIY